MTIQFVNLEHPIDGKRKILDEKSFFDLYINSDKTVRDIAIENGLATTLISRSIQYYYTIYPDVIQKKKHRNYHRSSISDAHVLNINPSINLDKEKLALLISEGKTEQEISRIFSVAPQTVRRNVRKYKMKHPPQGLYRLSEQEWMDIEFIDQLSPGLLESAYHGQENPFLFFHKLYFAFLALVRLLWTTQKLGRRYNHYVDKKRLKRDYITWRINKQEIELSEALRRMDMEHIREYPWAKEAHKNFSADFYFEKANLIVEINGSAHGLSWVISKDREKEYLAKKLRYKRLVFTTKEIDDDVNAVVNEIRRTIYGEDSVS